MDILYLCDRKACSHCTNDQCHHTQDITHAVNFKPVPCDDMDTYFEIIPETEGQ